MADIEPRAGVVVDLTEGEEDAPAAARVADEPGVAVIADEPEEEGLPKHAKPLEDGSVELPLFVPVTLRYRKPGAAEVREERIERLVLRRLNGADMRAVTAASQAAAQAVAIARSARIPETKFNRIFDMMDAADANAAGMVVAHFLKNGPGTTGR